MAVTALFAELLVTGILTSLWLIALVLAIYGPTVIRWEALKDWLPVIAIPVTASCYALGVIIDRIADSVFPSLPYLRRRKKVRLVWRNRRTLRQGPRWKQEIRLLKLQREGPSVPKMRLLVMSKNKEVHTFLEYIRSRIRITRTTALNSALLTAACLFYAVRHNANLWPAAVGFGFPLVAASIYAAVAVQATYDKRVRQAYRLLKGEETQEKKKATEPKGHASA